MNEYYNEVDTKPPGVIVIKGKDGASYLAKDEAQPDYSPRLPAQSVAQTIQTILAAPAPVPSRHAETVSRERLAGDSSKVTPIQRAIASVIRSSKYLLVVAIIGLVAYVAIPTVSGVTVTFFTLVAMSAVMLVFDAMEYRHSQSGVERLRSQLDHKLEGQHEQNRHVETMTAIEGDIEIKLKVLDLAAGNRQIGDRGQRMIGGE